MAGGVIPGLNFAGRRRFHRTSDSLLSMATRGFTRQPSSSSSSSLRRNKSNQTQQEEKHGTKAKKSSDEKGRPQSKSQTMREISCGTSATRDLYRSSLPSLQRNNASQTAEDQRLGVEAKMAKERLDKRLRPHLKSQINREISKQRNQAIQWKGTIFGYGKFNWIEMKRKTYEQEHCLVCLEELRNGESQVLLPCGHKFHSHCSRKWLQINPHCPCCRNLNYPLK